MPLDFTDCDAALSHLDGLISTVTDPFIRSRYTGFVAVSSITAYEVNIRRHVVEFCASKHKVFGSFSEKIFEETNARVKIQNLRDDFLRRFGNKYLFRFNKKLDKEEVRGLTYGQGSLKSSYANLIQWRHDFVHDGILPTYATFEEARAAYERGKLVIECFTDSLKR